MTLPPRADEVVEPHAGADTQRWGMAAVAHSWFFWPGR